MAINIIDSFKLNNPLPLDSKYIVKDAAALSALLSDSTSYAGLLCYEKESKTLYILEQNGLGLLAKALFVNGVAQETAGDNAAAAAQEKIFKLQVALGLEKLADSGNDSVNIITRLANLEDDNAEARLTSLENIQAGNRLSSLESLHAKGKTVANEVAEGIARVVADAPKDFDTLKEVADWIQSDTSGAARMQADISELQNKVGTINVPTQITNAVNKLDATVGSTTIASGKHVAVEVVQTDGKLTSATVNENDIASAVGLKAVSDLVGTTPVSTQIMNAINKLDVAVGSTTVPAGKHVAVQVIETDGKLVSATVTESDIASAAELKAVCDLVGTTSVPTQITNAVNSLDATVRSNMDTSDTVTAAQKVGVKVVETDGKLTSVLVKTNDIASAASLKAVSDLVGTTAVATQITNAVNGLDATVRSNMDTADAVTAAQKVGVKVVETDGKLTSVLIKTNDIASAASLKSVSDLVGTTNVATQITNAVNALDATVRSNMDTSDAVTAAQKVGVKVVETDGKLTSVLVKTNDIASAATLKSVSDLVGTTSVTSQINNIVKNYMPLGGGTMGSASYISWPDSGNYNKTGVTYPVDRGGLYWVGQSDSIKLYAEETENDNLELVLRLTDNNTEGLSIRNRDNVQTARIKADGTITATGVYVNGTAVSLNGHTHDDRYYTESEMNTKLNAKANLSGATFTGAINTANNTWNSIGDDAKLGDCNQTGCIGIQGTNGNTGIAFSRYGATTTYDKLIDNGGSLQWNGTTLSLNGHGHSNYLGAVTANGYTGMARNDGNTTDWIRTTTAGIIPYQSGGAGGGHCGLGTSSWYFSSAYIDTVNSVRTYGAVWNDYAELFPRAAGDDETSTEPGDLIAYDYTGSQEGYRRATEADGFVVGVHTDEFAHLIGGDIPQNNKNLLEYNLPRYIPVSLAGRVWVNIKPGTVAKPGQYVVPSDMPGKGVAQNKRSENAVGRIVALDLQNNRVRIKVFC